MLEQKGFASLAEKVIFVAGHKVTTDPVAIPFSMVRGKTLFYTVLYTLYAL